MSTHHLAAAAIVSSLSRALLTVSCFPPSPEAPEVQGTVLRSLTAFHPAAPAPSPDVVRRFVSTSECTECDLRGADLHGRSFVRVSLHRSKLDRANLSGASFLGDHEATGYVVGTSFDRANLASFYAWRVVYYGASFDEANLAGAKFVDCLLRGCTLKGADLRGANLSGTTLVAMDFSGADLRGANLSGAKVDNVIFAGAKLGGAIWIDGRVCGEGSIGQCR